MARPGPDQLNIALVIPRSGPAGIYGPSCEACAELAIADVNLTSGLLGRQVGFTVIDGSRPPADVAARIAGLVARGEIDAVTGWHISPVRQAVARVTAGRIPYFYGPLYEGGESTPGVFLTGETPSRQLLPAMDWMSSEYGVERWIVVGNDYIWPRQTGSAARRHAHRKGMPLVGEAYVPLGTEDFSQVLRQVDTSRATGVVVLLVGADGVQFNRQFASLGLDRIIPRLSPHVEENMLMAAGADANNGLFAAAGYFESLNTSASLEFAAHYYRRYGEDAPALNAIGESCYEAMALLVTLASQAGSLSVPALSRAAQSLSYVSPRGEVRLHGNQMLQDVYVAEAMGLDFEIRDRIVAV